jgi:excisionase family DNA binding protein
MTWLRVDEAAAAMGVSRRTIYRWISQGLPHRVTTTGIRIHVTTLVTRQRRARLTRP